MVSAASFPLPCSLFPCQGSSESLAFCRTLVPWTKNQRCGRRKAATSVTAKLELKPPPYPLDALEPHMSEEILTYHWGKHHRGYVENLNKQVAETELDAMPLEDIIALTYNKGDILPPFNNAAQIWNHEFFWESMRPNGGGRPTGDLLELIERDFGSFEKFSKEFQAAALTQFGSGWAWLAYKANRLDVGNAVNPRPTDEDKKLVVVKSPNAVNPLVWDYSPLLTIDVWEHAYYLDYKNRRADYISTFMDKLVSWKAVSSRLVVAKAKAAEREKQEERRRQEEDSIAGFGRRQEEDGIAKFDKNSEALDTILDSEIDEAEAE